MPENLLNDLTDDQIEILEATIRDALEEEKDEELPLEITEVNAGSHSYDVTINISAETMGRILNH